MSQLRTSQPDRQGLGLGRHLTATVFERADLTGLPCYLANGRPDFVVHPHHHGIEVRSEWNVDLNATQGEIGLTYGA